MRGISFESKQRYLVTAKTSGDIPFWGLCDFVRIWIGVDQDIKNEFDGQYDPMCWPQFIANQTVINLWKKFKIMS